MRHFAFFMCMALLALLFLVVGRSYTISQNYLFDTEIINVEDGLPHRITYSLLQDKKGFIWVSTQGAISRYDGYRFKNYNAAQLNIAENQASYLAIDFANRLWYCEKNSRTPASGAINVSNGRVQGIETISKGLFSSKEICYIENSAINRDDILIATWAGVVYKYNGNFEEIYRFSRPFYTPPICSAKPDNSYWIIRGELALKVKDGKSIKTIAIGHGNHVKEILSCNPQLILEMDSPAPGYLKLEGDTFTSFSIVPQAREETNRLLYWHRDYICYVSGNKVLIQDRKGKVIYSFEVFGLGGQDIELIPNATFQDYQGILWAATENGLLKVSVKRNPFETLFSGNGMRAIYRDKEDLWVGGGNILDAPNFVKTESEYFGSESDDAMSFFKDLQGHLWIGTASSRVVEYDPEEGTFQQYPYNFPGYDFHLLFQNPVTKRYWIGSNNGLFRFDPLDKSLIPFNLPVASEDLTIRQFHQNTQGIWVASSNGIFLMDNEKEQVLKHFTTGNGLPTNSINHIHEDEDGIFWLGTKDAGLVSWNLQTNSFSQFTSEDDLSNDKIYAVYEDEYETLWLTSDYGLMAFDKNTRTTRVYLPKDGIAHEEFNYFSHFQDQNGTLYFGGLNGITKFHPKELHGETDAIRPLYATRIRVLKKNTETFTDKTESYLSSQEISLSPEDRILEVGLTFLDYERSGANQFAYKISGKQEQWVYTKDDKLSIINPPLGQYDLVIKARGASGGWSENTLIIPVFRSSPFYQTWWFFALVTVSIVLAIVGVFKLRLRRLEKDQKRLESEVQKRTEQIERDKQFIEQQAQGLQELDKAKSRFFANITHEFRTPLTLVKGPIQQMMENPPSPKEFNGRLQGVLNNADNLLDLINQLLDLSKLEDGRMKIEISHGDIVHFSEKLVHSLKPLADQKKLSLQFTSNIPCWKIHFDSGKWSKILHNLLSNAIKFTPENGTVKVDFQQLNVAGAEYMQLQVVDTGIGIGAEYLDHIFDRFYQADSSATKLQGGTGIGLSLVKELTELLNGAVTATSSISQGTSFFVKIPVIKVADHSQVSPWELETIPPVPTSIPTVQENKDRAFLASAEEKLKLLIVEDNAEMRTYIHSCIDASVYDISEAADGESGFAKALEMVPDLIISDVMMPRKSGFELARNIRETTATSHIPLILLTAKTSLGSRLEGLELGADAYLTKPFSPQELAVRIKKLIAVRKLLRQRYQNTGNPPEENPVFRKEDRFIAELKTHILDHCSEPDLNVETIGRHFGLSRMQLHRKLKVLINQPIGSYIRSVRMEKARELLEQKQLTISEIAYETGFSPSNFAKVFKKAFGKTPSEV